MNQRNEKEMFQQLCEDFQYNLGLLEERDAEIGHLEKVIQELKKKNNEKYLFEILSESIHCVIKGIMK
jgi:hypothetical protein